MCAAHLQKKGDNGMKRTFSLLLSLVLILAVFPTNSAMAGREEDCQHFLNQGRTYKTYGIVDAYSHVEWTWETYYCPYCDVLFESMAWYVASENQGHTFSNNKCTLCGYKKASASSGSCNHVDHNSTPFGDIEYTQIWGDSTNHQVERHYKITCSDCGKVIDDNYVGTTTEKHDFDWYGECFKCGYTESGYSYATATATPKPSSSSNSDFYVRPTVSFVEGTTKISWVDGKNNGPYEVIYWQTGCGGSMDNAIPNVNGKSVTTSRMVPGCSYAIAVRNSKGNYTDTVNVTIPSASTFVDGKLQASSIKVDIEYRTRKSYQADMDAQKVSILYASDIEDGLDGNTRYGLRYTINLPQLAKERTYHTMIVFRDTYGATHTEYYEVYTYPRYANSTGYTYWYCLGEDFFYRLNYVHNGIPTGTYYVDLYWDGMLVNTTPFYVR